jgi:DnaJ-class molecular chaperone
MVPEVIELKGPMQIHRIPCEQCNGTGQHAGNPCVKCEGAGYCIPTNNTTQDKRGGASGQQSKEAENR